MLLLASLFLTLEAVEPAQARWISPMDYPAEAASKQAKGRTEFTLTFNEEGRVTGCLITGSARNAALDATACRLSARRGRALAGTPRQQSFFVDWEPFSR